MLKIFKELYTNQTLSCIYANCNDTSKFIFGKIIAIGKQQIAIQMITPDGDDDGISVIFLNNVNRVEINSQYVRKMEKLYFPKTAPNYDLQINNDNVIMGVLIFAFKQNEIVSIELIDSGYNDIMGIIEEIDDIECKVQQYDEYGNKDGVVYFLISDISKVSVLTQSEKRVKRLTRHKGDKRSRTGDGSVSNTGDGSLC